MNLICSGHEMSSAQWLWGATFYNGASKTYVVCFNLATNNVPIYLSSICKPLRELRFAGSFLAF